MVSRFVKIFEHDFARSLMVFARSFKNNIMIFIEDFLGGFLRILKVSLEDPLGSGKKLKDPWVL